jgi:Flp pilus assembly protein TadB
MMLFGVLGVIFCCLLGGFCGISSGLVQMRMVDEVNQHLAEGERLSPYGWTPWKTMRLLREYRRLCPSGKSIGQLRALAALIILDLVVIALILQFPLMIVAWLMVGGTLLAWLVFRSPSTA